MFNVFRYYSTLFGKEILINVPEKFRRGFLFIFFVVVGLVAS